MSQQAINEREWRDPANWSAPRWLGFYFSKRDSRAWVPKAVPAFGWTPNLAHPRGAASLLLIMLAIALIGPLACAFAH